MELEMYSRSESISERSLVPSTLRSVVVALHEQPGRDHAPDKHTHTHGQTHQTDCTIQTVIFSERSLVPSTLRSVVCASRRVE